MSELVPLIRPPALQKGDSIGVVASSYSPRAGWLARGIKSLERAGYGVIVDPDLHTTRRYQRAEDQRRAESFTRLWTNPDVKALVGGTGGYGAVRMLPYLDPEVFRSHPKAFVGYSDITALHLWLMRLAGLRSFHGPTVDDLIPSARDLTTGSMLSALTNPRPTARFGRGVARAVNPGRATGRLVGGNMAMVQQTIGTPYEIDTTDAILFLEEVRDPMSFVDERLVQLRAAGLLGKVRGIVFGHLSLDRSEEDEFEDFVLDLVSDLGVPVVMDFPAGHDSPNLTLPMGTDVELIAEEGTGWLVYREDALAASPAARRPVTDVQPDQFDLVVIGAGPAGEKGAAQAAYFGKKVCLIEKAPKPGGAAVNTGTVPSKTLRETALYFSGLRQRGLYGVDLRVKSDITIGDFMRRERSVIETEWQIIGENIEKHGIATMQGAACFLDANTVEVTRYGQPARRVSGKTFLIATGSSPQSSLAYSVDNEVVVDSDSILTLQKIPTSMVVIGGGVIGCEYACIFAALGVRVTIVNGRGRLLAHMDRDVSDALCQSMTARLGITVLGNAEVTHVEVDAGRAHLTMSDDMALSTDCVLVCTGRMGNSGGLGLEALGVRSNARGFIQVDAQYRTAVPNIYAAGDVIGFPALASASMEQARVAICHAFDLKYKRRVSDVLPYGVWTIPEIATVGESEEALQARGVPYEIGRASFRLNARGQILGDTDGFVKLLFHPEDQRLLGVTIVGESACEMIHVGMTAIAFGATIDYFIQAAFNFPSLTDAYKYAAYDGLQRLQRRHARVPGLPTLRNLETIKG